MLRRLAFWIGARRRADELAAELEDHRARVQAALEADGISPAEAGVRSRRAMGNVTLAREDARDVWLSTAVRQIWRDAAYGLRALRREPTFAMTALLTLALGCLTTITVFSIANAELWRPLPFPDAHRLFVVSAERPGVPFDDVSGPDFSGWVRECRLAAYAAEQSPARRLLDAGSPESVVVLPVTTNFFTVLGRTPFPGRDFTPDDERGRTAIVSGPAWRRLFNADPTVIGRTVTLDGAAYTIVGVDADGRLEFRSDPDFFVPIDSAAAVMHDRAARQLQIYGRLARGTTIAQAETELRAVHARIGAAFPADHETETFQLFDLQNRLTGFNWRQLYFFLGAAVLLMVLSCLNVANLLLSRALRRQREFAIRGALGGGTGALVRQLLVEGAVLAIPGSLAGWMGATWLVRVFAAIVPSGLLQRGGDLSPDARVAGFTAVLATVITAALALSPLVFARRIDLNVMLGHGARTAGRPRQRAVRAGLLIGQISATLVLLAGAGLFVLSFVRMTHSPLGFDPHDRVLMRIVLPAGQYRDDAARLALAERWLADARAVAGVREAAVGSEAPLAPNGLPGVEIAVSGRPDAGPGDRPIALCFSISPRYFAALNIPLLDGRDFRASDAAGGTPVAIVNELFARRLFPGERAVGRTVELLPRHAAEKPDRRDIVTIVGVVGNVRNFSISEVDYSNIYVPFTQTTPPGVSLPAVSLVAATSIPAPNVIEPLRRASRQAAPLLPAATVTLGTDRVSDTLRGARFNLSLIGVFAALALVVAGVGVYGSMACAVEERTREFGVRIALGARPRAILGEALRESVRVGFAGAIVGTFALVVLARLLGNALYLVPNKHMGLLYDVSMTDPAVLATACLVLTGVAAAAGLAPARRATRVDPLVVLRTE